MIKNYTITGKTDGLGCQLNAVFSAIAFCEHDPDYIYVHTPFYSISHGWGWQKDESKSSWEKRTNTIRDFIGIPNGRSENVKIHTRGMRGNKNVFNDRRPSRWYDEKTLRKLRNWYWSTPKPSPCEQDIVIHIRRGDVNQKDSAQRRFYIPNSFYNKKIPKILKHYPDDYTVAIHTEYEKHLKDDFLQFESIIHDWPDSIKNRIVWKIGEPYNPNCENNLTKAFHDMVTAKVFIQGRSGLSYTSAILNENEVWFLSGKKAETGQRYPLDHWRLLELHEGSKTPDGTIYSDFCKDLEEGKYD